jgi:predicted metal-dependent hydrolase
VVHVGVTPLPYTVEYESGLASVRPSLTADGRIDLYWRLVLAPRPIAAHALVGRDRDPADPGFWTAVEALVPNARASGRWLRRNGARLRI